MEIRSRTKGDIRVLEILVLQKADSDHRYVAVLEGYMTPVFYNELGICEAANGERGDVAFDLVMRT